MPGTLTKADIIDAIQDGNGYSRKKSNECVETLIELIKNILQSGEDVLVTGFGKFSVKSKNKTKGQESSYWW